MEIKNIFILLLIFYLLSIFQTSFLVHFDIKGIVPNLIVIAVFVLNILEGPEKETGIFAALVAGFLWDIFSEKFIGYHILILTLFSISIKVILRNYVRVQITKKA